MPTINVGDADLHYQIDDFTDPWEPAETILLHHGAGRHGGFWYPWIPLLSRRYRVLRLDARGHGLSSKPTPGYQWRLETFSDDVSSLLDALDLERVHFVGESTGGLIGLLVALNHAERLHSLTLCSSLFRVSQETHQRMGAGGRDWLPTLEQIGQREWILQTMHTRVEIEKMAPGFINWFADESARVPQHVMEGVLHCVAGTDLYDRLPEVHTPTLILAHSTVLSHLCRFSAPCGVVSLTPSWSFFGTTVMP